MSFPLLQYCECCVCVCRVTFAAKALCAVSKGKNAHIGHIRQNNMVCEERENIQMRVENKVFFLHRRRKWREKRAERYQAKYTLRSCSCTCCRERKKEKSGQMAHNTRTQKRICYKINEPVFIAKIVAFFLFFPA